MPKMAACPGCGGSRWKPPRPGGFRFHGVHYRRVACAECGLMGLDPTPGVEVWPLMYSEGYFNAYSVHHSTSAGYAAGREVAERVAEARLDRILPCAASGRLLDVGCAGGHFLAVARRRGYDVLGVEYSSAMAAYARDTYSLPVLEGDVLHLDLPGPFDIVHMEDVLEHLADPLAVLRKLHALLAPTGRLVLDGPLERQPNLALGLLELNLRLKDVEDPEMAPAHVWQFTLATQRRLLARAGFREERAWVYQEDGHAIAPGVTGLQRLRRRAAAAVGALSSWISRQPFLSFLSHGDRALVLYRRTEAP